MKYLLKSLVMPGLLSMGAAMLSACATTCSCSPMSNDCGCESKPCACSDCTCRGAEGRWAIQRPGAFWLGICNQTGQPKAKLLWGGGSPVDQTEVKLDGIDHLVMREEDIMGVLA